MTDTEPADLHPAAHAARAQALSRLAKEAATHATNARIMARRADDPEDFDITPAKAAEFQALADQHTARLRETAAAHGTTPEAASAAIAEERRAEITGHLNLWRDQRAVHQDFVDHPEHYGHVDLAGRPLDMAQQRSYLKAYDAAITEAETELAALG